MSKTIRMVTASFFLAIVLAAAHGAPQSQSAGACGNPTNGVQMCLTSSGSILELAFQNVGDRDVTLNLGVMMANGKVQLPDRIAIKLTDAQGKTRLFKFSDKRYGAVGGRLDDYVLPLRAGSTYTLRLTLDQFWCRETKEFTLPLKPGLNSLTAEFEGAGAQYVNLDMPAIKLMNFWLGKAESNVLTMRR